MEPILRDSESQQFLIEHGYVKLDFFHDSELTNIINLYNNFKNNIEQNSQGGIHMTTWMPEGSEKSAITKELAEQFEPACHRILLNHRLLNPVFIVKHRHPASAFPLHQDWSFVDENLHWSLNIWVSLFDLKKKGGQLHVLPGSHRLPNKLRGAGSLNFDYGPAEQFLKTKLVPIGLKAGQAILFFHSTVHGSEPNRRLKTRVIAAASAIPEKAPLQVNFAVPGTQRVEQYQTADDFLASYKDVRAESGLIPPVGRLINTLEPYHYPDMPLKTLFDPSSSGQVRQNWLPVWWRKLTAQQ